ncbi:MAG TPA: hypothetical protein VGJ75_25205 [Dongiaceae bacterium]
MKSKTTFIALLALLTQVALAADKPNVVIMLGDNVGYGDIGAYGAGEVRGMPTPRIDSIARNGFPAIFNIEADPREENNVVGTSAWVIGPYLKVVGDYLKTLEKYPNPKPVRLTEFGK